MTRVKAKGGGKNKGEEGQGPQGTNTDDDKDEGQQLGMTRDHKETRTTDNKDA
jgi:hypothetical protein